MQKSIKCEFMMGALTNQETYRIRDLQDSLFLSHQNHWNLKVPYKARWDLHDSGIIG
jgi:hypothetical protein